MSLEDIAAITEDGCLLSTAERHPSELKAALSKRMDLLNRHISRLDEQIRQLETVKALARQKTAYYSAVLDGNTDSDRS
ncbi:hypothetical protein E5161_11420 [Cohnella pontilimi]|uniref:MerR family transcriptional regulator n=2 Tax=Cohnella pontilimi TaxID=2564100 RepID=A0A4U0FAI5_9BACL|nr:hypothetical protein E5161_11420 [Cohnella pontilimi]